MKFSYTLVAALVGAAAASPIGEPSLSKRVDTAKVKEEVQKLNTLIANFQEAKDKKQESKGEGWQQTIDLLKERAAAIEAAPEDKVAEEINKLDEPLARIRKSREGAIDRYTRNLFGFVDAKDRLTEAAK
ncbi:hypothetical protein X797_012075 [Metarhizium robertsii]|uniref:Uncharacterized protein n=2 Tax=Metarhizium robertsii TaxID=568076 RepID=E9EMU5_METRA|nr:uncharacterized protein MAA_00363 [Metarhizium robertsii ARSEF 23]EFZ03289.1 hypothetical protein MAA_00363 [Metarhizium robertsii ARSEF 23]EXU94846.1 hypothetical protein X797_012075 [Metarhizium robertsii]